MKKNNSKKTKKGKIDNNRKSLVIMMIAIILILLIGATYAWLTVTKKAEKVNTITASTLSMTLDDNAAEGIELLSAVPTRDETGKKGTAYTFIVENTGNITTDYIISLESQSLESLSGGSSLLPMPQNRIKYNLAKVIKSKVGNTRDSENDTIISSDTEGVTAILNPSYSGSDDKVAAIDSGSIEAKQYIEYSLKLWMDENATYDEMENTAYIGRIRMDAQQQGVE